MSTTKEHKGADLSQKKDSVDFVSAANQLESELQSLEGTDRAPKLVSLAEVYRRLRKYSKAETALTSALSLAPNDIHALLEQAELASQRKDYPIALMCWDKVLSHPTSIKPAYVNRRRNKIAGELLSEELKQDYEDLVKRRIQNHQGYHAVWLDDIHSKSVSRDGEERWEIIKKVIEKYNVKSFLDLGCAEGFYVRKAANIGCFSIGVDNNPEIFALSQAAKNIEKEQNSGFVLNKISETLFDTLPEFDMVICLSVLHHVIRIEGLESMKGYMRRIAKIHKKAFLFDMGTSLEAGQKSELPDMGADPAVWIRALLEDCGFKNIEQIGSTPSPNGVSRPFFLCRPE